MTELRIDLADNDIDIEKKPSVKYFGLIIIDQNHRCKEHAEYVAIKMRTLITNLKLDQKLFYKTLMRIVYNSLFQTHISYGITVWGVITGTKNG